MVRVLVDVLLLVELLELFPLLVIERSDVPPWYFDPVTVIIAVCRMSCVSTLMVVAFKLPVVTE